MKNKKGFTLIELLAVIVILSIIMIIAVPKILDVIENSKNILEYHYNLLDIMNIEDKIIIIHIGSNTFGKKQSLTRFIHQFQTLPKYLKESILKR